MARVSIPTTANKIEEEEEEEEEEEKGEKEGEEGREGLRSRFVSSHKRESCDHASEA